MRKNRFPDPDKVFSGSLENAFCLQHGDESGNGTGKAKTGLEARGGTGELGDRSLGGHGVATGGRGLEGLRDGQVASGLDDAGRGSAAGGSGGNRGSNVDGGGGGARGALGRGRSRAGLVGRRGSSRGLGGVTVLGRLNSRGGGNRGGAGRSDGAGLSWLLVGDTELSGVLVVAVDVVDQLDTVTTGAGGALERGGRSPGVAAGVVDALNDDLVEDRVGGGALEQDQGDLVGGVGSPLDGEGLASGDGLGEVSIVS